MTDHLTKTLAEALRLVVDQEWMATRERDQVLWRRQQPMFRTAREALALFDAAQQAAGEPVPAFSMRGDGTTTQAEFQSLMAVGFGAACAQQAAGEQALPPLPEPDDFISVVTEGGEDGEAAVWREGKVLAYARAAQAAQPLPVRDGREAFEATQEPGCTGRSPSTGEYYYYDVRIAWKAWQQARAAIPQPAPEAQQGAPSPAQQGEPSEERHTASDVLRYARGDEALTGWLDRTLVPAVVVEGSWAHLKLQLEAVAWDQKLNLEDALATVDDFVRDYACPECRTSPQAQPAQAVPLSAFEQAQGFARFAGVPDGHAHSAIWFARGVAFAESHHGIGVKLAGGAEGV